MYALFKDGKITTIKPVQIPLGNMHKLKEGGFVGIPTMYAIDIDGSLIVHPSASEGYTIEEVKE